MQIGVLRGPALRKKCAVSTSGGWGRETEVAWDPMAPRFSWDLTPLPWEWVLGHVPSPSSQAVVG